MQISKLGVAMKKDTDNNEVVKGVVLRSAEHLAFFDEAEDEL